MNMDLIVSLKTWGGEGAHRHPFKKCLVQLMQFGALFGPLCLQAAPLPDQAAMPRTEVGAVNDVPAEQAPKEHKPEEEAKSPPAEPSNIEWLGQVFRLTLHRSNPQVDEAQYCLAGESPNSWTQLLVVQRAKTGQSLSAGIFIARLRDSLGKDAKILGEGKEAALLFCPGVSSDKTRPSSCAILCLALQSQRQAATLEIIQYSQKTAMIDASLGELQLKAWRDRFIQLAKERNFPAETAHTPSTLVGEEPTADHE